MKISTKGRYGLRAMVDIAVNSAGEHVALNSIAERQGISENYLEQVFSMLRKAGLVKSVKGAQGGYSLAENPSIMSVGEILRALEGDLSVFDEDPADKSDPHTIESILSSRVWGKINECINEVVDAMTLEDIVDAYKEITGKQSLMFYI